MKNLLLVLSFFIFYKINAQIVTVGKSTVQYVEKLQDDGTLYTVIYNKNSELFSTDQIIGDAKIGSGTGIIATSINTGLVNSDVTILKNVPKNGTNTPVQYWISSVLVSSSPCNSYTKLEYFGTFKVFRRQTVENFTCRTYPLGSGFEAPFKIQYLSYAPEEYFHSSTKYPLVIACHGDGEKGSNIEAVRSSFLANRIENGLETGMISVSPQTNGWKPAWTNKDWMKEMVDSLCKKYRVDTSKIFVIGYSGGGGGVTTYTQNFNPAGVATFAAIITLSPLEHCKLKDKKVWSFQCLDDYTIKPANTEYFIKSVRNCGNTNAKVSYYSAGGHKPWVKGLATDSLFQYFIK